MEKLTMTLTARATLTLVLLFCKTTSFAQDKWSLCKPVETVSFSGRVHVKCETPVDGAFLYFACSTEDARFASRMLNICLAGQVAEKTLTILFAPNDTSGVAFGCLANDCRTVRAIGITETAAPIVVASQTPTPTPTPSISDIRRRCEQQCKEEVTDCRRANPASFCEYWKRACLEDCQR